MEEHFSCTNTLSNVLNSQMDLLVEILASQRVLTNIVLAHLASQQDRNIEDLEQNFTKQKDENRESIAEYIFGKFGPDLEKLL